MGADSTRALLADRMGPEEGTAPTPQGIPQPVGPGRRRKPAPPPPPRVAASGTESRPTSLRLTPGERSYIDSLADILDRSPRRTLRFINTYRIMKASYPAADLQELEDGGYRALLALLALTVNGGQALELLTSRLPPEPLADDKQDPADVERSQKALRLFNASGGNRSDFARYEPLVARFSFEPARS
jgi:hypothetical protein